MDEGREERIPGVNQNARHLLKVSVEDVRKAVKRLRMGKCQGYMGLQVKCLSMVVKVI